MGMPGSETALEELMNRVLGDHIMSGWCAKLADDLYIGGSTPNELLDHGCLFLATMSKNNLGLNPAKTIIAPQNKTILGWEWENGTLKASPHKVSALAMTDPPQTIEGLRSFVGAYKVLSHVLHGYAVLLDPLDKATAGRDSQAKIKWNDDLLKAFSAAQSALKNCKSISIPSDQVWIVTDASVGTGGIAATLYVCRGGKTLLSGFYNAKL